MIGFQTEYIAYLYNLLKETGSAISLCNFLKTTTEDLPAGDRTGNGDGHEE
jgi:hypothetical protein